jgi:hypothetical protein
MALSFISPGCSLRRIVSGGTDQAAAQCTLPLFPCTCDLPRDDRQSYPHKRASPRASLGAASRRRSAWSQRLLRNLRRAAPHLPAVLNSALMAAFDISEAYWLIRSRDQTTHRGVAWRSQTRFRVHCGGLTILIGILSVSIETLRITPDLCYK